MPTIERAVEVSVPASVAYNQWTQFEQFPRFMEDVEEVKQIDDRRLHWRAKLAGKIEEWDAEITEQIPDKRIAWRATDGAPNAGVVTFHRIDDDHSRVMVQMDYEPHGIVENAGSLLGIFGKRVERDLQQFREFIERRGAATGAWRGEVTAKDDRGH